MLNPHSVFSAKTNRDSRGITSSQLMKSIRSMSSVSSLVDNGVANWSHGATTSTAFLRIRRRLLVLFRHQVARDLLFGLGVAAGIHTGF